MRGESRCELAEPVVTTLVCFLQSANEAAGAVSARLSLRPLRFRGTTNWQHSGETAPRECERMFSGHCERSDPSPLAAQAPQGGCPPKRLSAKAEAIHLSAHGTVDCFVAWLLAMTMVGCLTIESEARACALPLVMPGLAAFAKASACQVNLSPRRSLGGGGARASTTYSLP